jgi:hypothetical protein
MRAALVLSFAATMSSCVPGLGPGDWLVTRPRILAVRAEPPEGKPGATATFAALVVTPDGTTAAPSVDWRWCVAPEPLTENGAVASACLDAASLLPAGTGAAVAASTPSDACALFGPDTPPGGYRPRDPDATGGFYQPLRSDVSGAPVTFDLVRVLCDLGRAPAAIASQFAASYVPNANPHLLALVATVAGVTIDLGAVPAGATVDLEASWPPADAETFAYFDPDTQTLSTQREAMRVAWYTTAGVLATESTGRASSDPLATTDNTWTAPSSGTAHLWLVLRDSRGGVDFASYDANVVGP